MELYRWQRDSLERWEKNGYRGILHVITGAGKTVTALEGSRRLERRLRREEAETELRLRIVVPTIAIARQWVRAVEKAYEEENRTEHRRIGLWYGEEKAGTDCFCLIYVVNSARHALPAQIIREMDQGHAVMLIADECHHYGSAENRKIFDFRNSAGFREDLYYAMGLSATPQCEHFEDELVPALGPEIYWYSLRQAIHEGTVSSFSVFQVDVSFTGKEADRYGKLTQRLIKCYRLLIRAYPQLKEGPFFPQVRALAEELADPESLPQQYLDLIMARRELCLRAKNRIKCAVALTEKRAPNERVILFCERIDQAEAVRAVLRERMPSQTGMYHSEMLPEKRREVLRDFRDGIIHILIACKALDEGVDVPEARMGIVLSSTLTDRQRIQRLGRILRRTEGKRSAALYYLHVGEEADEREYLPEENDGQPTADLIYNAQANCFDSPEYTALARNALRKAQEKGMDSRAIRELRKQMDDGISEPEWLMRPSELDEMLETTKDQKERNRLIAMKLIAQTREGCFQENK